MKSSFLIPGLFSATLLAHSGHGDELRNPVFDPKKPLVLNEPALPAYGGWPQAEQPLDCSKQGGWMLQTPYKVAITATKNKNIPVPGVFERMRGTIQTDAARKLLQEVHGWVDLRSYNSGVPDRDRRVQRYVLGAEKFPEAEFKGRLVPAIPAPEKGSAQTRLEGKLNFNGNDFAITLPVRIERIDARTLQIASTAPATIDIDKDALRPGLMKLLELCNHESLSTGVAVSLEARVIDGCSK